MSSISDFKIKNNFFIENRFRKRGFGFRQVEYFFRDGLLLLKLYYYRYWNYSPCKKIISALLLCDPFRRSAHVHDIVVLGMPEFDIKIVGIVRRLSAGGHVLIAIGSKEAFRVSLPVIKEFCPEIAELATPVRLDCAELIGILKRYRSSNPPFGSSWINIYEYSF